MGFSLRSILARVLVALLLLQSSMAIACPMLGDEPINIAITSSSGQEADHDGCHSAEQAQPADCCEGDCDQQRCGKLSALSNLTPATPTRLASAINHDLPPARPQTRQNSIYHPPIH